MTGGLAPPDNPYAKEFPEGISQHTVGGFSSFVSHAACGVLPMAGGMAATGTGAEAGAAVGSLAGPIGAAAGGLIGGLGGFFLGSSAVSSAQDWALHELPDSAQEAIGQSDRMQRMQEAQHPYYSMLGGLAPYALTMSPGALTTKTLGLPENATAFQRLMANPVTGRLFGGAAMGGMELGQEKLEGQPADWTNVAISTAFGIIFNRPTRFGEYLTDVGARPIAELFHPTAIPPEGVLHPTEPTVAQAGDLGVVGPGTTEETFRGEHERSIATQTAAQNAAADEQAALGAQPQADLEHIARRIEPETFQRNDELLAQRDALRQFIQSESNPPEDAFEDLALRRSTVDAALRASNPNSPDARNYRAMLKDLDAQQQELQGRREAWESGTYADTPDVALARQHLLDTEHELWDLGPQISAAMRRAADHAGQIEEEPVAAEAPPPEATPEAPVEAPAAKSEAAQQNFIVADRTEQLVAAGQPRAVALANAHIEAAYYKTLADRFGGALGTAEELYRARAARIAGVAGAEPETPPTPITREAPTPTKIRTIADIQAQDGVSAGRAKKIQEQEILAIGRVVTPGEPRREPTVTRQPTPPVEARELELAEVPQETVATPEARPRLRSAAEIMREDRVGEAGVKAVQERELTALADWQARNPVSGPRPRRNRATLQLADDVGVPATGVPEPEVLAEIVDRLPEERVVEEITAAFEAGETEYQEAEKAAEEVAPEVRENPDTFYDADQGRSLEELENEARQENAPAASEQRLGGGGEPEPAARGEEPLPEGGGPPGPGGGVAERGAAEGGERGNVAEPTVERGGVGPAAAGEHGAEGERGAEPVQVTPHWLNDLTEEQRQRVYAEMRPVAPKEFTPEGGELHQEKIPLYSPTANAVDRLRQERGTGEQMLAAIIKTPGVKPEEIKWMGLGDWLRDQKSVTRDQIADYVRANTLDVREVQKGGERPTQFTVSSAGGPISSLDGPARFDTMQDAEAELARRQRATPNAFHNIAELPQAETRTKFGSYTFPGGENYREMLITLPVDTAAETAAKGARLAELLERERTLRAQRAFSSDPGVQADFDRQIRNNYMQMEVVRNEPVGQRGSYRSPHWDEPNVLAHVRFSDRTAPDGKKVLLVEEVQSDWHQQGRKRGYGSSPAEIDRQLVALGDEYDRTTDVNRRSEIDSLVRDLRERRDQASTHVPDAPFKTTWPQLAMKRMIKYAADNGFDRIAWTPGDVQAARYDLSKQISNIELKDQGAAHYLTALDLNGRRVIGQVIHDPEKELPDIIGKEVTERLLSQERQAITLLPRVRQFELDAESRQHDWRVTTPDGRALEVGKGTVAGEEEAKEYAARVFNDRAEGINKRRKEQGASRELSGLDLKVGGEGMKGFYDKMLPNEVQKIVGKFGAVGKSDVGIDYANRDSVKPDAQAIHDHDAEWQHVLDQIHKVQAEHADPRTAPTDPLYRELDRIHAQMVDETMARGQAQPVHSVDITPQMRDAIEQHGLPLFQAAQREVQGKIRISPGNVRSVITLARSADASTFMHETAHDWLKQLMQDAMHELAPAQLRTDAAIVRAWLKRPEGWTGFKRDGSPDVAPQERFARGFEQYLREGRAPSRELAGVFAQFKQWLTTIYRTLRGLGAPISDDIRGVFDRMLAIEPRERTVYTPDREHQPGLGAIHAADAAETEPHEAEAVADRLANERNRAATTPPPEVENELGAQEAATGGPGEPGAAAQPGGEAGGGAGGGGEVAPPGGQPQPGAEGVGVGAGHGAVGAGRGEATAEGAGVPERPGAANGRRGAGATAGADQFAPRPAESFADREPNPNVDLAGNIRVENLTDIESIAQAIHDSADRNDEFKAVRGGMTKGQMSDLADAMGLDPSQIDQATLARMFGGTQELGAKVLAARRLVVQSAGIVSDLMKVAAKNWTDEDGGRLAVAIARHDMIQSFLAGVTAEWGRAGNAFHSLLDGWGKAQDLNQLLRDNLGRDLYQLKAIAKMGSRLDTPGQMSKFLTDAKRPSFGRMLLEYWVNGLISGPATHVTYSIGNAILAAEKGGPETAIAAGIGAIRARFGREGTRVRLGEVGAGLGGAIREMPTAARATTEALRTGLTTQLPGEAARPMMPFQGETGLVRGGQTTNAPVTWREAGAGAYGLLQGIRDGIVSTAELVSAGGEPGAPLMGWQSSPRGAIPNLQYRGVTVAPVGELARGPSRMIAAIHSLYRSTNYSMEINALAYRQAVEEGLTGTALAARTAALRQNPPDEMMDAARGRATELTLMGQGGKLTQALSDLTNRSFSVPFLGETQLLKFIDPFVHIAGNIMNQAIMQRTPAGLFSPEIRADLMGKNGNIAADTAAARLLAGTTLAMAAGGLAAQGLISGSGPADPKKAAVWQQAGNQAHSVRIGDMWYDMHRLGPMGMLLSISADMYDVGHAVTAEDAATAGSALMHAFTQNILDESFMRGPADLIKATTDPGRYGQRYVANFLSSFMPYSVGMAQMARATDPYLRQARTIMDTIRSKMPGMSESLLPRRDIWGDPMPSGGALAAPGVTAIYTRKMSADPVNLAMWNLGIYPAQIERQIRNVPLTDQQYDDFSRVAGRLAKMQLDATVPSQYFQSLTRDVRHDMIEHIITGARETARGIIMMKYPDIPREATIVAQRRHQAPPAPE